MIHLQFVRRAMLVLLLIVGSTHLLSAQAVEAYVFAGGTSKGTSVFKPDFDTNFDTNFKSKMVAGGTYGVKVGGFIDTNFELDGNLSWYNHFGVSAPTDIQIFRFSNELDIKSRALLWEMSGTYNFGEHKVGARFSPYVTLGIGGLTARLKNADSVFVTGGGFIAVPVTVNPLIGPTVTSTVLVPNPARQIVMDNNDTFLTFSYGGGIKALKLWGPTGIRFEIRGRTIPNFYSRGVTMPEYTGGLTFSWGER